MNESAGFDGRSTLRRVRLDLTFDAFAVVAGGPHQFVGQLEAEPDSGRGSEVASEAQVIFRRAMDTANVTSSGPTSSHLEASSSHLEAMSAHLSQETEEWRRLEDISESIRKSGKASKNALRERILQICSDHFLTSEQFGLLLGRDPNGLRARYLTPMQKEGLLEHRFPSSPNHKQQAYRKKP